MNVHFSVALRKNSKASQSLFPVSALKKAGKNMNWVVDYIDRSTAILNALPCFATVCSLTPVFKKRSVELLLSRPALSKPHNQQQEQREPARSLLP